LHRFVVGSKFAAIFFDWDDTLLSSSFLWNNGIRLDSEFDPIHHSELKSNLGELACVVQNVIQKAATFGTVHIITNAEAGWVERSAEKFLPGVLPLLSSVEVVSARSTFEAEFPEAPLKWKEHAFDTRLKTFLSKGQSSTNVVSFGDSNVEREAVRAVTGQIPNCRTKSVKFAERPTIEQLKRQLELISNCFHYLCGHDGDLDLQLTVTPLPPTATSTSNSTPSTTTDSSTPSTVSTTSPRPTLHEEGAVSTLKRARNSLPTCRTEHNRSFRSLVTSAAQGS